MSASPNITQCFVYVGFLQFLLLQGFSHAAISLRSLRKERKHLEQRQRVQRLTTDGKFSSYLQFSSHQDSSNSAFLSTVKLTHMFTILSALCVKMPEPLHFLVAIWMSSLFGVSWTRLRVWCTSQWAAEELGSQLDMGAQWSQEHKGDKTAETPSSAAAPELGNELSKIVQVIISASDPGNLPARSLQVLILVARISFPWTKWF